MAEARSKRLLWCVGSRRNDSVKNALYLLLAIILAYIIWHIVWPLIAGIASLVIMIGLLVLFGYLVYVIYKAMQRQKI
jgi:hypothetical protein